MIPAIVLAAGHSARMGRPKAGLSLPDGQTFLGAITRGLVDGGASRVLVVTAPGDEVTPAALPADLTARVELIVNTEPERGQLSSLQCGLVRVGEAPAALVTLVDVPLIEAPLVRALIAAWMRTGAQLVRPTRAGRHGHPMLVGRALMADLLGAHAAGSARPIVRRYASRAIELPVEDDGPLLDVDTPEAYTRLLQRLAAERGD